MHNRAPDGSKLSPPYMMVHEVYYDDAMNPTGCTVKPVFVGGESISEIETQLEQMLSDTERPPLDYERFVGDGKAASTNEDGGMESMWGEEPLDQYDPTSEVHCAWELFTRYGFIPSRSHVKDLSEARREIEGLKEQILQMRAGAPQNPAFSKIRSFACSIMSRLGI
jgi:hypothetical protein